MTEPMMDDALKMILEQINDKIDSVENKVDSVLVEARKTNGRVNVLEEKYSQFKGWLLGVGGAAGVIVTLVQLLK